MAPVPTNRALAKEFRPSPEAIKKIKRQEERNATGYQAVLNTLLGSDWTGK